MSDSVVLADKLKEIVSSKMSTMVEETKAQFLAEVKDYIDGVKAPKLLELLDRIAEFKMHALATTDVGEARDYAKAAETAVRRLRTIAIGEGIVASQEAANVLAAAASTVFGVLASVGKEILSAVTAGLVSGLVESISGAVAGEAPKTEKPF